MIRYTILDKGDKVQGKYHGVPFTGVVSRVEVASHSADSVFVDLDSSILVFGDRRQKVLYRVCLGISQRNDHYIVPKATNLVVPTKGLFED